MKKTPIKTQYRQGDILIERIDTAPSGLKQLPTEKGRVILAHGEVTGHAHEIEKPQLASLHECHVAVRLLGDLDGAERMTRSILVMRGNSAAIHNEHTRIPLTTGDHRITRQREYSPEALRNVED